MKAGIAGIVALACCVGCAISADAAEDKTGTAAPAMAAAPAEARSGIGRAMPARPRARSNFGVVFGPVTKIDTADPARMMVEVKNEADGKVHAIELTPRTTVTKITDISEVKTGETVRVMTRTADGKETAMGVSFGKVKNTPVARPFAPVAGSGAKPAAPAQKGK